MKKPFKAEISSKGKAAFLTLLVIQTSTSLHLGHKTIDSYAGDIILIRGKTGYASNQSLLAYHFDKKLFDSLFYAQTADCRIFFDFMNDKAMHEEYLYFSPKGSVYVENLLDLLKTESRYEDIHHEKMIRLILVGLFTQLERNRDETLIVEKSTMVSGNRFGKIMKYLGDNFRTATLQETAERFGYNPDYLSTRFKKITGETFRHKLLSIRLEKASDLIVSTEMTVEEVSDAVGFHDKSWFMKKFKERYGMTPVQYRKSHS